ncbi:MAG: radical SAM family heme chaperone HemW [Candidatus Gracilibacteria bacterium]
MNNNFCYIHIPFCTSKCKYCHFASFGNLNEVKVALYVEHLLDEINNNKMDFNNLKSIYFGGGTPSVLSIKQLGSIIKALKNKYNFDKKIEINLEATPITITKENIISWKKIGINRLSIGIQTLNNDSLIEIGRGKKGDIIGALGNINQIGFDNVSVDFIIGLPHVKKGGIKKEIKYILDNYTFIKHISVYMLEEQYYPGNWDDLSINEKDYLEEYIEISNFLKNKGFNKYEVSNFALSGYECIHNKAYWDHSNILAFGLGAHGFINNIRYSNSEKFVDYYLGKQKSEEKLIANDLFLEKVMFQLRTNGLTKKTYEKLDTDKINYFIEEKYLEKKSDKIILSDKGVLVLDYILGKIV